MSGVGPNGVDYIWLPLDPNDSIFMGPVTNDFDTKSNVWRSPIYALFTGISSADTYRVEVVSTWEYVPTLTFESWAPSQSSNVSTDVLRESRDFISKNVPILVRGVS